MMKGMAVALLFLSTLVFAGEDTMLIEGSKAPDFTLKSHDGAAVTLSSFAGKKAVVLIFYPGDETPVCTQQLCEIRDDYSSFEKKNAVVFGVNPGSTGSHTKFVEKHSFKFPLLVDEKGKVAQLYKTKGMLMNKRTVYVINSEGTIVFAKRGKPPVQEILQSISE